MQIRAAQRNTELREEWMRKLASYTADQLVFVDESAANERTGHRTCGWSPVGIRPHEYRVLESSKYWSILPAYTIDGFVTWKIEHVSCTWRINWVITFVLVTSRYQHIKTLYMAII